MENNKNYTEKTSHYGEPINSNKPLSGYGRHGFQVPAEVQQKVVDIIIEEARKSSFNNRDLAYYIAIAKCESTFNPDAANENGTASGIAQVIDKTGATFGVNDTNRFDARTSIKAGLKYFELLKQATITDYGSAAGKFEPLIYFRYHYGEFSTTHAGIVEYKVKNIIKTRNGRVPTEFSKLESDRKYLIAQAVLDDAIRIEKILNDTHALSVKLTDVLGKPVQGRPVIGVQKKQKIAPVAAPVSSVPVPAVVPAVPVAAPILAPAVAITEKIADGKTKEEEKPIAECKPLPLPIVEWELVAFEVRTDATGNIPVIESDAHEPVMILIPRIDFSAYNDAVAQKIICETVIEHVLYPRDGDNIPKPEIKPEDDKLKTSPPVVSVKKIDPPTPKNIPTNVFDAASANPKGKTALPSPGPDITFNDIIIAIKKDLGWENVYQTSFSYVKQFYTRPKLPEKPLDKDTITKKGEPRTQVVGSSLKNAEIKSNIVKVKDKVVTANETATKTVEAAGDAKWMPFAIQEQNKSGLDEVKEVDGSQENDGEWREKHSLRESAIKKIKSENLELKKEKIKSEKLRDEKKIDALEKSVKEQEVIRDKSNSEMLEIEEKYNNKDILKYFRSTGLADDAARNDRNSWCSSYINWCMEQAGFHGTGSAAAASWLNWGEKIDEPRYGAITVTTRGINPVKYHVGFFLGIGHKNVADGEEEIKEKGKHGEDIVKKRKKIKSVETVRLLSGNYSQKIKEGDQWMVDPEENPTFHLVSYRWPTSKEKK
ncbi:uncharacterized protein (TIGR02594 family) [Oxalobacteraceae bacterium GrIS 1.11]